jgi:hypothetical protein
MSPLLIIYYSGSWSGPHQKIPFPWSESLLQGWFPALYAKSKGMWGHYSQLKNTSFSLYVDESLCNTTLFEVMLTSWTQQALEWIWSYVWAKERTMRRNCPLFTLLNHWNDQTSSSFYILSMWVNKFPVIKTSLNGIFWKPNTLR